MVINTRLGDLDPGLLWYLARTEGLDAKRFNEMVNFQSGPKSAPLIWSDAGRVASCVIRTGEELMIADQSPASSQTPCGFVEFAPRTS